MLLFIFLPSRVHFAWFSCRRSRLTLVSHNTVSTDCLLSAYYWFALLCHRLRHYFGFSLRLVIFVYLLLICFIDSFCRIHDPTITLAVTFALAVTRNSLSLLFIRISKRYILIELILSHSFDSIIFLKLTSHRRRTYLSRRYVILYSYLGFHLKKLLQKVVEIFLRLTVSPHVWRIVIVMRRIDQTTLRF